MMRGYVQIYTGNGKGKTTAALGLSLRAAGAGLKVYIGQFLKKGDYSEIKALQCLSDAITIEQFGLGSFVKGKPTREEIHAAHRGLERLKHVMASGDYDIIVVDEGNVAAACGLFDVQRLLDLIAARPNDTELVITGRGAAPAVMEKADLVTEMVEIKHYYQKGVAARTGVEK
jgi:cob(I)alamin adenosyltransferase